MYFFELDPNWDYQSITSDTITVTRTETIVDPSGSTSSDHLSTINGGSIGDLLVLRNADNTRSVTVKDRVGNIHLLDGDSTLNNTNTQLRLLYTGSVWTEIHTCEVAPRRSDGDGTVELTQFEVGFVRSASTARKDAATHEVTVQLNASNAGLLQEPLVVNYTIDHGTPKTGTVTFPVGSGDGATKTITVFLDYIDDEDMVTLTGVASGKGSLGSQITHEVTLQYNTWSWTYQLDGIGTPPVDTEYGRAEWMPLYHNSNRATFTPSVGAEDVFWKPYLNGGTARLCQITLPIDDTILTSVIATYDRSLPSSHETSGDLQVLLNGRFVGIGGRLNGGGSNLTRSWSGTQIINEIYLDGRVYIDTRSKTDHGGSMTITKVEINGRGPKPRQFS